MAGMQERRFWDWRAHLMRRLLIHHSRPLWGRRDSADIEARGVADPKPCPCKEHDHRFHVFAAPRSVPKIVFPLHGWQPVARVINPS